MPTRSYRQVCQIAILYSHIPYNFNQQKKKINHYHEDTDNNSQMKHLKKKEGNIYLEN